MTFTVFANAGRRVLPLITDPAAGVRTGSAWVLRAIRCEDPAALDAVRRQAAVEDDPTALVSQLLTVGTLSGLSSSVVADPSQEGRAWLRPWLEHAHPLVRLAAAEGVLSAGTPDGEVTAGAGRAVARTFTDTGRGSLPDVPWWPGGNGPVGRFAELLAPHPQETATLGRVGALADHRRPRDGTPGVRRGGTGGLGRPVLRYLADLGPLAAPYADAVRPLLTCPGEWSRVGAAEAWWRITGDAAPAVEALLPELAPLASHRVTPVTLRTVRARGAIGRPAAAALPVLQAVMSSRRRHGGDILRDEELFRVTRKALSCIVQPVTPPGDGSPPRPGPATP